MLNILLMIEELIFELALWVILLPKTFFKVIVHPNWIHGYIDQEFQKDPTDRFEAFLSPLTFWVLLGIIPVFIITRLLTSSDIFFVLNGILYKGMTRIPEFFFGTKFAFEFKKLMEISIKARFFILVSFFMIGPVVFSVSVKFAKKIPFNRNEFQRIFYAQTMCFAPLNFFNSLSVKFVGGSQGQSLDELLKPDSDLNFYSFALIYIGIWTWFFYAEMQIVRNELGCGLSKAICIFLFSMLAMSALNFTIPLVALGLARDFAQVWDPANYS